MSLLSDTETLQYRREEASVDTWQAILTLVLFFLSSAPSLHRSWLECSCARRRPRSHLPVSCHRTNVLCQDDVQCARYVASDLHQSCSSQATTPPSQLHHSPAHLRAASPRNWGVQWPHRPRRDCGNRWHSAAEHHGPLPFLSTIAFFSLSVFVLSDQLLGVHLHLPRRDRSFPLFSLLGRHQRRLFGTCSLLLPLSLLSDLWRRGRKCKLFAPKMRPSHRTHMSEL